MSSQQTVRDALRRIWSRLVDETLPAALAASQARRVAADVVEALTANPFDPAKYSLVAGTSRDLLDRSCPIDTCRAEISAAITSAAESALASIVPGERHAAGGRLRSLVQAEMAAHWDDLRRRFDALCESRGSDRFADIQETKAAVLAGLAEKVRVTALAHTAAGGTGDETELKRRAKALAVLLDDRLAPSDRDAVLKNLAASPNTATFPYVLRYLFPGKLPRVAPLPRDGSASPEAFPEALLACCPEASLVRHALLRFENRESLFGEFADIEAPVAGELQGRFEHLPDFVAGPSSSLLLPKSNAVQAHRADRYRIPDGIVAALGLCLAIEWTLRQGTFVAGAGAHAKPRVADLTRRLHDVGILDAETRERLAPLFDWSALSIRDALVHGVFHGNDSDAVRRVVLAASDCLQRVVHDITKNVPKVFETPRWDSPSPLSAPHVAFAQGQLTRGAVLFDQITDDDRKHLFGVLAALTPDKRLLGQASFLFFVHAYRELATRKEMARNELFAACLGLLISLEDLFRAVAERHGIGVLRISPQPGDAVKCGLSILDDTPGNLLSAASIARVFGGNATVGLSDAFVAARSFRDSLFHGHLSVLTSNGFSFTHLAAKLLFALSASI